MWKTNATLPVSRALVHSAQRFFTSDGLLCRSAKEGQKSWATRLEVLGRLGPKQKPRDHGTRPSASSFVRQSREHDTRSETSSLQPRKLVSIVTKGTSLPYFKFIEMLNKRLHFLATSTSAFRKIAEAYQAPESRELAEKYVSGIVAQPASSYALTVGAAGAKKGQPLLTEYPTLKELKAAYEATGLPGLDDCIMANFELYVAMSLLSPADLERQKSLASLERPSDWFPVARSMSRKLILHVGPTNSGKTYHALQKLRKAESGCFAGPLRLLAFEIYERFNKDGIPCNLITGEEERTDPNVQLNSCTIEMLNISTPIDVLVIDEIQMIGDPERGAAWTQALLGCPAKEIHMCGEASVVDLITKIAASLGDTLEVRQYQRLGALEPMNKSLGGTFNDIQKGDAVVSFSRRDIFNIKKLIERTTDKKCAVVYGGLPPETRAQQASLFNDPDSGFDVMVASDAIGMGLNLSIKRVIFETVNKWNGKEIIKLPIPQVKQIAGRAGRFKPKMKVNVNEPDPPKNVPGYVTTLRDADLPYLHESLATPTVQLEAAYLRPPDDTVQAFTHAYPPEMKLSVIMRHFQSLAQVSDLYKIQDLSKDATIQDLVAPYKGLKFSDRWTLYDAPLNKRDHASVQAFLEMIRLWSSGETVDIFKLKDVDIDLLDQETPDTQDKLSAFESLHAQLTTYLWLSSRFPGIFISLDEAYQLKQLTEEMILDGLLIIKTKRVAKRMHEPFLNMHMIMQGKAQRSHEDNSETFRSRYSKTSPQPRNLERR